MMAMGDGEGLLVSLFIMKIYFVHSIDFSPGRRRFYRFIPLIWKGLGEFYKSSMNILHPETIFKMLTKNLLLVILA